MEEPDRTTNSFGVPLCLWQGAAFLSPASSGSATSSSRSGGWRDESDSVRLRLAQLDHEYWREVSRGVHPLHTERLTQCLRQQYSVAMDCSESVDSIAAAVKVLASNQKRESSEWKSQISLETLLAIPGMKATDRDKRIEELPLETPPMAVSDLQPQSEAPPSNHTMPLPSLRSGSLARPTKSNGSPPHHPQHHPSQQPSRGITAVSQFSYPATTTSGPKGNRRGKIGGGCVRGRAEEDEESGDEDSKTNRWCGRRGYRGQRRRGGGNWDWGSRKRAKKQEEEEEEEDKEQSPSPFISARDQHVLNQQRKYGGRRVQSSGVDTTSYGSSKKSLGTRRTAGSRFVPPVRREDRESDGGKGVCLDAVQTRVQQYGGPSSSSSSGGALPPELEGDERLRNIEPRMVELIMNEIMDHGAPVEWEDIAGLQFAKDTIKEIVVWPMLRPDIFTGLRGPPKGILLFGPPGTGKTLIGKCIASQVKATFFSISASSLTSKWIGEGEKMVRALFAVARVYQPAVIFMDEIDSLLSQRSDSEHESSRRIKTEFLVQLDGATTSEDDRILIIGATNRPQEIDEAARRRLVKRLYIPLPDSAARKRIVSNLLKKQAYSLTPEELEELSTTTEGYSGADMANLCREAAYGPVREAAETIQHISADAMRPVYFKDFQAALHVIRPSVSEQDLDLYVQWNKQFGCGKR